MSNLRESLGQAIEYSKAQGIDIPVDLYLRAFKVGAIKAKGSISDSGAEYHNRITEALTTFFEGGSITAPKNQFKRAVVDAFGSVFNQGWTDGGQDLPVDGEALNWFEARVNQEFGNIDLLFEQAKELRKDDSFDFFSWVTARADSYTSTLSAIYNTAKLFASKNKVLFWRLGNTEKHCDTCLKLDGQSHRASWYIARNYIPRMPLASMECKGFNCDCHLEDKEGNEVTI